jgi:hypothetical protein
MSDLFHAPIKPSIVHCREFHDIYRKQVIEKYRELILTKGEILDSLHELEGKVLGCWCKPVMEIF